MAVFGLPQRRLGQQQTRGFLLIDLLSETIPEVGISAVRGPAVCVYGRHASVFVKY